jgi:hypothetical protein
VTARPEYRRTGAAPVSRSNDSLADILERVLDKGVVIAGDIMVNVLDIELLTLKVRLLIASVDTAREMGIDWWTTDPFLTGNNQLQRENQELKRRIEQLERQMVAAGAPESDEASIGERRQERRQVPAGSARHRNGSARPGNGASDG